MTVSLSLRDYARTEFEPANGRRQARPKPQHTCDLRTEHRMTYHSPDGRTFQVRRLRCDGCGRRFRDVQEQEVTFALPTLRGDSISVEANF